MNTFDKHPKDHLDYDVDLRDWLRESGGDTVQGVDVVIEGGDELAKERVDVFDDYVKVWLSGGTHGKRYTVRFKVQTAGGRTKHTQFAVRVMER